MDKYLIGIGKKIRQLRLEKDLKLYEVADGANVSKGLLSKIENGRTVPSLPVLIAIIKALKVNFNEFFGDLDAGGEFKYLLFKAEAQEVIEKEYDAVGFEYRSVMSHSLSTEGFEVVILNISPDSYREKVTTDAWELKYMLEGELEYEIEEELIPLKKGDTLFYDGRLPHVPHNRTQQPASMLVVYLFDNKKM